MAVQPDQEVFPGQLRSGDPDQQLPAGMTAAAVLDRSDHRVQASDHVQSLDQLSAIMKFPRLEGSAIT